MDLTDTIPDGHHAAEIAEAHGASNGENTKGAPLLRRPVLA